MTSKKKNLSSYNPDSVPSGEGMIVGIIVADWNPEITHTLLDGACQSLKEHGVLEEDIIIKNVPGTFELTFAAKTLCETQSVDAIICIGCVIQGETKHFDYICQSVTHGITELNLRYDVPFIFGVLTTDNFDQAKERAGGKHGNKGTEAAITALKMVSLTDDLYSNYSIEEDDEDYFDDEFLN